MPTERIVNYRPQTVIKTNDSRVYEAVLLTEGPGNPVDKHYYTQACIDDESTAKAFQGKPCYANHLGLIDEKNLPERDIDDIIGWWENVRPDGNRLIGDLRVIAGESRRPYIELIDASVMFREAHVDQNLMGFSISASGDIEPMQYEGETWKAVQRITDAESCDAVTKPARGGMALGIREAFLESLKEAKDQLEKNLKEAEQLDLLPALKELREKIVAGLDEKDLRRSVDNIITQIGGENKEGEAMGTKTKVTTPSGVAVEHKDDTPSPVGAGSPSDPGANQDEALAMKGKSKVATEADTDEAEDEEEAEADADEAEDDADEAEDEDEDEEEAEADTADDDEDDADEAEAKKIAYQATRGGKKMSFNEALVKVKAKRLKEARKEIKEMKLNKIMKESGLSKTQRDLVRPLISKMKTEDQKKFVENWKEASKESMKESTSFISLGRSTSTATTENKDMAEDYASFSREN